MAKTLEKPRPSETSVSGSVSVWLEGLKNGDELAAQRLYNGYFEALVNRARRKLVGRAARRAADEEDVAISAFASFCEAAKNGRFPRLNDRHDLWQLLVMITERKAIDLVVYENCPTRMPTAPQSAAVTPSPEFTIMVGEEYARLLARLGDPKLQNVAVWKMEGYTIPEIAEKLECAPRTVDNMLKLIRRSRVDSGTRSGGGETIPIRCCQAWAFRLRMD